MKHQYFGDINDYRKYGLLRHLSNFGEMTTSVCWMLTPDTSGNTDGQKLTYLEKPEKYRHHDPALFDLLHDKVYRRGVRNVNTACMAKILPNSWLYNDLVPIDDADRKAWLETFIHKAHGSDLVFFDPDNGMEVPSVGRGAKDSSKYLYWHEVKQAYSEGYSLLIYQHFPRVSRSVFVASVMDRFREDMGAKVVTFATGNVAFFFAPADNSAQYNISRISQMTQWGGQIKVIF